MNNFPDSFLIASTNVKMLREISLKATQLEGTETPLRAGETVFMPKAWAQILAVFGYATIL